MKVRHSPSAIARLAIFFMSFLFVLPVTVAPTAVASAILDQGASFKGDGSYGGVSSSQSMAQIFTPGISGSLTKVALGIAKNGTVTNLTIGIYQAASGIPTGSALASTTITDFSGMSTGQVMFDVDFTSPTAVTAGSTYAIVATTTDSTSGIFFSWYLTSTYAGGYAASNTVGLWNSQPSYPAFTFSTYVLVSSSSSASSAADSSAPSVETSSINTGSSGSTCTNNRVTGTYGTWIILPGANDCTTPPSKPGATLLGWATNPNFPVEIAQRQVDNGWGAYETFNADGQSTGVFIPAGGATFLSASGNLYPIWSE